MRRLLEWQWIGDFSLHAEIAHERKYSRIAPIFLVYLLLVDCPTKTKQNGIPFFLAFLGLARYLN